jgi:CARDB
MRRLAAIACLLLAPLAAPVGAGAAPERPPLQARLVACTTGPSAVARKATFTASMPAVARAARMAIRFDLLQRGPGDAAFARVALPAWGRWERSQPGRTGFIYTKTVRALHAPGAYRASVRFRWYDAGGQVVRRAHRRTPICRQPDPRPDLQAAALTTAPGLGPATVTYLLTVRNGGRGAAGPFAVGLATTGMPQSPVAVSGLAPGESRVVELAGPRCAPGSTVRFVLDPANAVAESVEADDVVDRACPVAG